MAWYIWDFDVSGNLDAVLVALEEVLTGMMERLQAGESRIGRGMPRGAYARLLLNPPVVTWEHETRFGEVVPVVRVSGYDLLTVPGQEERRVELGDLVVLTLADGGGGWLTVRIAYSGEVHEAFDVAGSILYHMEGRWLSAWPDARRPEHRSSILRDFEQARRKRLQAEVAASRQAKVKRSPERRRLIDLVLRLHAENPGWTMGDIADDLSTMPATRVRRYLRSGDEFSEEHVKNAYKAARSDDPSLPTFEAGWDRLAERRRKDGG